MKWIMLLILGMATPARALLTTTVLQGKVTESYRVALFPDITGPFILPSETPATMTVIYDPSLFLGPYDDYFFGAPMDWTITSGEVRLEVNTRNVQRIPGGFYNPGWGSRLTFGSQELSISDASGGFFPKNQSGIGVGYYVPHEPQGLWCFMQFLFDPAPETAPNAQNGPGVPVPEPCGALTLMGGLAALIGAFSGSRGRQSQSRSGAGSH